MREWAISDPDGSRGPGRRSFPDIRGGGVRGTPGGAAGQRAVGSGKPFDGHSSVRKSAMNLNLAFFLRHRGR
jgi:hypothetical protein